MKKFYNYKYFSSKKNILRTLVVYLFFYLQSLSTIAQCPPNIDYELGNFNNWRCWIGTHYLLPTGDTIDVGIPVPPMPGRHDIISAATLPLLDQYGFFPTLCPNGSGFSVKLGDNTVSPPTSKAQGVSYTFTIPPGQNRFSLIYHYAVIFLESVNTPHTPSQQASFVIEVKNLTDDSLIGCSSFSFHATSNVGGFFDSPVDPNVKCKDWAAASINLDGNAGKTIQVFFKSATCTPSGHFGYAYVDVNTECSSSFVGATFCPDDTLVNVTAPSGYQSYKWFDISNTILGTQQTLTLNPPPLSGDSVFVELTPFNGYGCLSILKAYLWDTLTVISNAGPDQLSCQNAPVQLGINPTPTYTYSWSPPTDLSDPNISNPIATPSITTQYILTVRNAGGGCLTTDTVIVNAAVLDTSMQLIGPSVFCLNDTTALLQVVTADSIQWYRNSVAIPGANQTQYNVVQSGDYYATLFSFIGCSLSTAVQNFTVHAVPVPGFNINAANQCFANNQFVFTNSSTIAAGTMQYNWDLGDGTTAITTNVNHSYAIEGTYVVKLLATSDNGCVDSISFTVIVYPSATAGFTVDITGQCLKNNEFVFTNTSTVSSGALASSWDMGDGNIITTKDVIYSYANPGTYTVKLLSTAQFGCADSISFDVKVYPQPVAGFTINNPQQCYGNNLFVFTNTSTILWGTLKYNWNFGDGNVDSTQDVSHTYAMPGDYIVQLRVTSDSGCVNTISFDTKVFPYPFAAFIVKEPGCINLPLQIINTTANNTSSTLIYLWDFGNGQSSSLRNPVYSYPAAGNYNMRLSISTAQCPLTISTKQSPVIIEAPAAGIVYPEKDAVFNYPERLQARQIGRTVVWTPATSLDNRYSYTPTFKGLSPQLYTIELKTLSGCLTVDTQLVKTHKKIEIYVPTAFTPGGNGINDYLRPVLMGFVKVNYFRVYNRWGKLLFQMQSDQPGWDGREKGDKAEIQTVVWMIEAVDVDGKIHKRQGTTVLLR